MVQAAISCHVVPRCGVFIADSATMGALKLQDWTQTDELARVDNAELDIVGQVRQCWTLPGWTMADGGVSQNYETCSA